MSRTSLNNKSCFLFSSSTLQVEENVSSNMFKKQDIISILGFNDSGLKPDTEEEVQCKKALTNDKQDVVWDLIMSHKKSVEAELPPPYVHPLLRKSNSTLSDKSLELCTENLGSETGSEGFSSHPPSEAGSEAVLDFGNEKEESSREENKNCLVDELLVVPKCNNPAAFGKKIMQPRSFPPPLSSLTCKDSEGSSVQMHSQRVNGRLLLQAVAVPSTKNFQAQRQHGRLRLTLFNTAASDEEQGKKHQVLDQEVTSNQKGNKLVEEEGKGMSNIFKKDDDDVEIDDDDEGDDNDNDNYKEEMCGGDKRTVNKKQEVRTKSINVLKSAFMIKKKFTGIEHPNSYKLNFIVKPLEFEAMSEEITVLPQFLPPRLSEEITVLPQFFPPRPRITRLMPATSANEETTLMMLQSLKIATQVLPAMSVATTATVFNFHEYSWRAKSAIGILKLIDHHSSTLTNKITNGGDEPQKKESVTLRNFQEIRSLVSWEPYCFAT